MNASLSAKCVSVSLLAGIEKLFPFRFFLPPGLPGLGAGHVVHGHLEGVHLGPPSSPFYEN